MYGGALKILTVDDREPYSTILKTSLADAFPQAQVFAARDNREVMESAAGADPDVIVLDPAASGVDVFGVCRALKADERLRLIPIVILTDGTMDRTSRTRALQEGAEAFLARPFDDVELAALVHAMAKLKAGNVRQQQEARRLAELVAQRTAGLERELAEHKKDREAIEAERQLTRAALDAQTDTFFVFQPSTGQAVQWNRAFSIVSGYSDQEIRSMKAPDSYYSREDLKKVAANIEQLLRGGAGATELELIAKGGRRIPTEYRASVVANAQGVPQYIVVLGRDISERKGAEASLRESEERFRRIFEEGSVGIATSGADFRILRANAAFCRMMGRTEAELRGLTFRDLTHPEDLRRDIGPVEDLLRGDIPVHRTEKRYVRPGAEVVWGSVTITVMRDPDGQFQYFLIMIEDITERKRAEDALRRSEARFRTLIEEAPVAIGIGRDLTHIYVNRAYLKMFGLKSLDEVVGRSLTGNWSPDWPALIEERARQRAQGLPVPPSFEAVAQRSDGSQFPAHAAMTRVELPDGPAVLAFITDISERRAAERERLDYQRRLRSLASELSLAEERERRRIATGLHDHACQTLVLSKMKLERLRMSLPSEASDAITDICRTLDETIESVREMTFDLSSPALYRFGLEAALKELLKDKLKTEYGIRCTFHDDGLAKPLAEDVRILLFQSVRELLVNIIKHARARQVTLDIGRVNHSIRIVVADDGVGFDVAGVLAVPPGRQGFGLFNIRERMDFIGGTLRIDSQPGHGSRFALLAPLETEAGT